MTTEIPMRLVGSGGASNWHSSKEATALTSSSNNMAAQELGLLLSEHRFQANGRDMVPNRSGSAPPSMEGSFASIGNLFGQQKSSLVESLTSLNNAIENCESEEQLRADPAYVAYYWANVNLNPRLPPPLISRENRHLAHRIGGFGDNRRLTSFDESSSRSLTRDVLSTHKEESEDERSPRQASSDWAEKSTGFLSRQYTRSLTGRHKSLVDLIQEDFPRTPSPVYNLSRSSSHAVTEEAVDADAQVNPTHGSPINTALVQELNTATAGIHGASPSLGVHFIGSLASSDPSPEVPLPSSSSADMTGSLPGLEREASSEDAHLDDSALSSGVAGSHINSIEAEMKGLSISNLTNAEGHRSNQERQHLQQSNPRHQLHPQRGANKVQGVHPQMISQGMHHTYNTMDHLSLGPNKFSSVEVQPVLQTSGMTPPLYATASAYMASGNPFYPNLQPSSLFAPQYSIGGYALNATLMPPFVAGYPPPTAIPMAYENPAGPSFNSRSVGVTTGESSAPGVDLQNLYKFYGQLGLALQPSFTGPLYMHYFQHPSEDAYGAAGQYSPLASRGDILGSHDAFNSQKGPPLVDYTADQKSETLRSGALNIPSSRKVGVASPNPYGSPPSLGILMQYPTSPLQSPVLPGSPMSGMSPGRKNENFRFPLGSNRNVGAYSGWQAQRGSEKFDDPKPFSFLEELKSSKARRFELSDIAGRIVEFSADQHGSRFIQQKLENCSAEEKISVFEEVLPHAPTLMTDVFGNYVIQKFFEHGSPEQRKELANQLAGRILPLSLQMYGCRVIQKALEVIELDQKTQLVRELDGHVMRCVRDQNGNHVIQKCIECVPTEKIGFIIFAFRDEVATLSTHPYGCRVIQRVLEHCTDDQQSQWIVDEILQSACSLAQDQYGNYVTQHVLERGKPHERSQIISKLAGQIVQMSQHKFASNVIEKCLEHGDAAERELLIEEIVGQTEGNDNLLIMMKDQFANYVVQKILETCTNKQREILLSRIRVHLHALKKYTYGKHIVARVEQLSGEETEPSES
ncbi:pumilio homolog 5 isoform X2 [Magnolia sinica]|uniref:pumilio homolog 5 isoform X2 n=1 Tax=Magnolia sinica TaxID=86752 RepID=UPI002659F1D4|nr:pumilio homolog 5 isoform X2 [Magnolia sinica]